MVKNNYVFLSDLGVQNVKFSYNGEYLEQTPTLVFVAEVQKSGAAVYFNMSNKMFTANNGKTYYKTFDKAYKSQDW